MFSSHPFAKIAGFTGHLIIVWLLTCSCSIHSHTKSNPKAVSGILDLTDWDFDRDGIVSLNGPWKFKWKEDSSVFTNPDYDASGWDSILVPATWKNTVHETYGYGWMRLTVIVRNNRHLGLYLKNDNNSADIYCNGKKLISFGITGNTPESDYQERRSRSIFLPQEDTLELAWKVVNFDDEVGGPRNSVIIANDNDILKFILKLNFQKTLIFGVLFIIFIYHILLWFRRRSDLSSLYFGLFCFIIIMRLLVTELVHFFDYDFKFWFYIISKIEYLTMPLGGAAMLLFLSELFPLDSSKKINRYMFGIFALLTTITIFTNQIFYTGIILLYQLSILLVVVLSLTILIKAILNKRPHAWVILAGVVVLAICVIYDILISHLPNNTNFTTSLGLVFFIIIQSSVLSFKFADAFNRAEYLSKNLKEEVVLKTKDIQLKSEQLRKINIELQKADEYKTRFFQNVTHEFKTPLTLITGPVHSIISGQYGEINESIKEQLQVVKQNGFITLNLVNQLLELAKSDVKQIGLKMTKHNIGDVLKNILANFEPLAEKNGIKTGFISDHASVISLIDIQKFERIFYNLLSNSFKFTKANGSVKITLSVTGDKNTEYKICVNDTGIGIPRENIPHIFKRFYKSYLSDTPDTQGTGIGLALVKEYTGLHGGQVEVSSTYGSGTGFVLTFPLLKNKEDIDEYIKTDRAIYEYNDNDPVSLVREEIAYYTGYADNTRDEAVAGPEGPDVNNKTIVIAEDKRDMRYYIKDILKSKYRVIEAVNGKQGFEMVITAMPDLIITDVMMPVMNGIELCKKLKTDIRTEHIPVIILTARSSSSDSIEGYLTGADDYVTKPFNRNLLLARIENLIESRNKLREYFKSRFLLEPEHTSVESNIEKFISRAITILEKNISDPAYNVEQFSNDIGMSQVQLYRKLTTVTGQTPAEFMRVIRLKKAAKMLEEAIEKDINVSEISFKLGFSNHSHFSQLFKKYYGLTPSDYAKKFQ